MTDQWVRTYDPVDHQSTARDLLHRERLLDRIAALTATPPSPQDQYDHRKVSGSPTPWNDRYAMLLLDVEAGARNLEIRLRYNLGLPYLPIEDPRGYRWARPGTRAHADLALTQTVLFAGQLHGREPDHDLAREAQTKTYRWARRARAVLDESRTDEIPWTRCPGGLTCHQCGQPLWLRPGWADDPSRIHVQPVYCRAQPCADENGMLLSYPSAVWAAAVSDPTARSDAAAVSS